MNSIKIKILYLFIFTICLAVPVSAMAKLNVVFENTPLFSEANILPGDSVSRYIKVSNPDDINYRVGTKAVDIADPDGLGDVLQLVISGHVSGIEYFNDSLSEFLNGDIVLLEDMSSGDSVQYDYYVYFEEQSGNDYQLKSLYFDIELGSEEGAVIDSFSASSYRGSSGQSYYEYNQIPQEDIVVKGESGEPNMSIGKIVEKLFANPGDENVPYKVIITNNSDFPAIGVVVTDELPEGLTFALNGEGSYTWAIGDLGPGEFKVLEYDVIIDDEISEGIYENTVMVKALNHEELVASTGLEIKKVKTLGIGEEFLEFSGFSIKEFIILIIFASSLFIISWRLRRKYLS